MRNRSTATGAGDLPSMRQLITRDQQGLCDALAVIDA